MACVKALAKMRMKFRNYFYNLLEKERRKDVRKYLSRKKYNRILKELKLAMTRESGRSYRRLHRYSFIIENKKERLVALAENDSTPLYYVANEDMFAILHSAHLKTLHGGKVLMTEKLKRRYKNVTSNVIDMYLKVCPCISTGKRIKPVESDENKYTCKEVICGVGFVDMQSRPDGPYKFILAFQDYGNKFVTFRPLESMETNVIEEELMNIFCTYGPANILHIDMTYTDEIVQNLKLKWPGIIIEEGRSYSELFGDLVKDTEETVDTWIRKNGHTKNWTAGLGFMQMANNTLRHNGINTYPFKAMFHRKIPQMAKESLLQENLQSSTVATKGSMTLLTDSPITSKLKNISILSGAQPTGTITTLDTGSMITENKTIAAGDTNMNLNKENTTNASAHGASGQGKIEKIEWKSVPNKENIACAEVNEEAASTSSIINGTENNSEAESMLIDRIRTTNHVNKLKPVFTKACKFCKSQTIFQCQSCETPTCDFCYESLCPQSQCSSTDTNIQIVCTNCVEKNKMFGYDVSNDNSEYGEHIYSSSSSDENDEADETDNQSIEECRLGKGLLVDAYLARLPPCPICKRKINSCQLENCPFCNKHVHDTCGTTKDIFSCANCLQNIKIPGTKKAEEDEPGQASKVCTICADIFLEVEFERKTCISCNSIVHNTCGEPQKVFECSLCIKLSDFLTTAEEIKTDENQDENAYNTEQKQLLANDKEEVQMRIVEEPKCEDGDGKRKLKDEQKEAIGTKRSKM